MRPYLSIALGIATTTIIGAILFSFVDFGAVVTLIQEKSWSGFALFAICSLLTTGARTWQWHLMLSLWVERIPLTRLYLIALVRNLCADLLPARLGTAIYIPLVHRHLGITYTTATTTFGISFLFDIFSVLPLLAIAAVVQHLLQAPLGGMFIVAGAGIGLAAFAILLFLPQLLRVTRHLPLPARVTTWITSIAGEVQFIRAQGVYRRLFLASFLVRTGKYVTLYFLLYALLAPQGYGWVSLPPFTVFLGLFAAEFAASLPASGIGGFGLYEGTWAVAFTLLGFSRELAISSGIAHHLITQAWGYGLGFIAFIVLLWFRARLAQPPSVSSSAG